MSNVTHLPAQPTARRQLLNHGAAALSHAQLLAALLNVSDEAASALLASHGTLHALTGLPPAELAALRGVGEARAATLAAAAELGRRLLRAEEPRPRLRTPREIADYLSPSMAGLRREVFHVLCFNSRNVLVRDVRVAEGTANACPVDPREVFSAAISARASGIVLSHNHPSGVMATACL